MGSYGLYGCWALGRPLEIIKSQPRFSSSHQSIETNDLDQPVPRRRRKSVLHDIGPVDAEDFSRVFMPCSDREVLNSGDIVILIRGQLGAEIHPFQRRCYQAA
jgi:hypothetical protein